MSSITLQLSFDPLGLTSESGAVLTGGPQWTGGTRTTSSSGQAVYTFLWTDPVGIGANYSTGVLTFRIPGDTAVLNPTPPAKSWQGLATSPTAQSATAVGGTIATPARDEPTPF
ncbi:hypothetical protein N3K63_01965 [Microbacterium sp. W1N]|uniref:hypothetical protein n=1 Tax=Microbacterium festucae TaxID=2977531 RepID=UPI0021C09FD6|nr:hypothetical protein [Microbacterium festucae]MCT9819046.1 hypothetical protein [Microbacterium festucae]